MKELLYTKYKLDYAYFVIENGQRKQVDAFAFSRVENELLQVQKLRLPYNDQINGTYAFYFDPKTEELRHVAWNFTIEGDTRGYVESRFRAVDGRELAQLELTPARLEQLRQMLLFARQQTADSTAVLLKLNLDCLTGQNWSNKNICAFLRAFYLLLPSVDAQRVIFISQYPDTLFRPELADENQQPSAVVSIQPEPWLLEVLHSSQNDFAYRTTLTMLWRELFGTAPVLPEDEKVSAFRWQTAEMLCRFWNSFQQTPPENARAAAHQQELEQFLCQQLTEEADKLRQEPEFSVRLSQYHRLLQLLRQPEYRQLCKMLQKALSFTHFHPSSSAESYFQEGFQVLRELGKDILPADRQYYSRLCFSYVRQADSGSKLEYAIRHLTSCSVTEFFRILSVKDLEPDALSALYTTLGQNSLLSLRQYQGYGNDDDFRKLDCDLQVTAVLAEQIGADFRDYLFEQYARTCQNKIRLQKLMPYYLNQQADLPELLRLLQDWKLEDFYISIDPAVFAMLAEAVKKSSLSEKETEQFAVFLQQYQAFRQQFDTALFRQEEDWEETLPELYQKHSPMILSLIQAYNACNSDQGRELLVFICRNISGNPAVLLFMMYVYTQKFIGRNNQFQYAYYYQFFELLLQPLMQADVLGITDIAYLVWMMQRNATEQTVTKKPIFSELLEKTDDLFSNSPPALKELLPQREEKVKDFQSLLLRRFQKRYGEDAFLRREVQRYSKAYLAMIDDSPLQKYCKPCITLLKKYISSLIRNY